MDGSGGEQQVKRTFVSVVRGSNVFVCHLCSWAICVRIHVGGSGGEKQVKRTFVSAYRFICIRMSSWVECVRMSFVFVGRWQWRRAAGKKDNCVRISFHMYLYEFVGQTCSYVICVRIYVGGSGGEQQGKRYKKNVHEKPVQKVVQLRLYI